MSQIVSIIKKNSNEYDQEILQSQTADKPMTLQERAKQQSRDISKANYYFSLFRWSCFVTKG